MRILRLRYRKLGGHYHCRVFTGMSNGTLAKCGELVFDQADWDQIARLFRDAQIVPEENSVHDPL